MTYQHDHLAWVQRCAQETSRKNKFEIDFMNNLIKPISRSKFSPKVKTQVTNAPNINSQYKKTFSDLLTVEQRRQLEDEEDAQVGDLALTLQLLAQNVNPYQLKAEVLREFRETLRSNSGFMASGPVKFNRNTSQVLSKTNYGSFAAKPLSNASSFIKTSSFKSNPDIEKKMGFFAHASAKLKRKKIDLSSTGTPGKSIYELCQPKYKVPEGLLYRGKYCGKSKLRERAAIYQEPISQKKDDFDELMSSVVPRSEVSSTKTGSRRMPLKDNNKLKEMKKFYPEEYFQRSGYVYKP